MAELLNERVNAETGFTNQYSGYIGVLDEQTIAELVAEFLQHAETHYTRDGEPTGAFYQYSCALRILVKMYGNWRVSAFTRRELYKVRDATDSDPALAVDTSPSASSTSITRVRVFLRWRVGLRGIFRGLRRAFLFRGGAG